MKSKDMQNQIIKLSETDSTNQYLSNLLKKENCREGLVITTDFQKKGRGQKKNVWISEPNKNLLLSILLKPDFLPIDRQFLLSKIISISIVELLEEFTENLSIKWPNDIYYANKKIAGILIENVLLGSTINSTVIGIGININQTKFSKKLPNPTSLCMITGKTYDNELLLNKLLFIINKWYVELKKGNIDKISNLYYQQMYLLKMIHIFKVENKKIEGKITGVSKIGKLIIEDAQGIKNEYNFKEIEF